MYHQGESRDDQQNCQVADAAGRMHARQELGGYEAEHGRRHRANGEWSGGHAQHAQTPPSALGGTYVDDAQDGVGDGGAESNAADAEGASKEDVQDRVEYTISQSDLHGKHGVAPGNEERR